MPKRPLPIEKAPKEGVTYSTRRMEREAQRAVRRREQEPQWRGWRPQTRGDCAEVARPCPFVGCRHHLFLDAKENGSIKMPYGADVEALNTMPDTCSLDVAARGPVTLEGVGEMLGVCRERVRQEEDEALEKLKASGELQDRGSSRLGETLYTGGPEDEDLEAIGIAESSTWARKLWQRALIADAKH